MTGGDASLVQKYVDQPVGPSPAGMYAFFTEHPELATEENLALLRASLAGTPTNKAKLKICAMEFCVKHGPTQFFESLSTNPPDAISLEFKQKLFDGLHQGHTHG
ncbi:hypothetical protein DIPPA_25680 [Diplonema papillatum]|nr:hypothetical protein DIPPA_25680 [Diplonema papillatum]